MILELLYKISRCPTYYQPSEEEQPTIDFLHKQGLITYIHRERAKGYHITLNGILFCRSKEAYEEYSV